MYENPISLMINDTIESVCKKIEDEEDKYIMECVRNVGVSVDRDELLKALQYDRQQYDKGYKDGLNKVCDIINEIFGTPCDYTINNRDVAEIINDEDFCEKHCNDCDGENYTECWKRVFDNYEYFKEND